MPAQVEEMLRQKEAEMEQYQEMLASRDKDLMALQEQLNEANGRLDRPDPHLEDQLQAYHAKIEEL